jgi:hypothetical protein
MKFMNPAETFGVSTLPLALEIPDVNAKPDDSGRGQLMEIYLNFLKLPLPSRKGGTKALP